MTKTTLDTISEQRDRWTDVRSTVTIVPIIARTRNMPGRSIVDTDALTSFTRGASTRGNDYSSDSDEERRERVEIDGQWICAVCRTRILDFLVVCDRLSFVTFETELFLKLLPFRGSSGNHTFVFNKLISTVTNLPVPPLSS